MPQISMMVEAELGNPLITIFPEFDPIPINISPFDQTHKAKLKDGRDVIVKIQRPGILEQVYEDLATLEDMAEFCDEHSATGKKYCVKSALQEVRKIILSELDYHQESHNLQFLKDNLETLDHIVVPTPISRFSTSKVLTLKYIQGKKLKEVSFLGLLAAERSALAGEIFHAYLKQILVDGLVHGDPDPDNILFTDTGKLALLDLGTVTRVSQTMQEKLLQILLGINEGRVEHVCDLLLTVGEKRENFDESKFRQGVQEFILFHRNNNTDGLEIGRVFIGIAQTAFKSGFFIPGELSTLGTTLISLDKIADLIDKNFDSRAFLNKNLAEIMRGQVMRSLSPTHLFQNLIEAFELLEKMPGKVGKILDAVAANELKITVDTIDEQVLMSGFQKIANRITMGLILAALILGAAQLMQIRTQFLIGGYPGLAILCFVLAAGCGFALVLEIFLTDRRASR